VARGGRLVTCGASSGGHLAMLVAMRPNDPRYAAIPGPAGVDASVQGGMMLWPVINPLSRYRNAIRRSKEANPPAFTKGMKEKHDTYWHTEAEMIEGNPMLILEKGEKVVMPPAFWLQGRPDEPGHLGLVMVFQVPGDGLGAGVQARGGELVPQLDDQVDRGWLECGR